MLFFTGNLLYKVIKNVQYDISCCVEFIPVIIMDYPLHLCGGTKISFKFLVDPLFIFGFITIFLFCQFACKFPIHISI